MTAKFMHFSSSMTASMARIAGLTVTGAYFALIVWLYAAHNKDLKAGVAFYGSLVDPDTQASIWPKSPTALAPQMQAPVLGLYGEADQGIPLTQVDAMKAALQGAGKTFEIKVYQGAPHGFHADYRASYRKEAAEEAWKEMIAWFKKYKVLS